MTLFRMSKISALPDIRGFFLFLFACCVMTFYSILYVHDGKLYFWQEKFAHHHLILSPSMGVAATIELEKKVMLLVYARVCVCVVSLSMHVYAVFVLACAYGGRVCVRI